MDSPAAPPRATTFTIDQLRLSPFNVRKSRAATEATVGLEASILQKGLLEPVLVHPMKGDRSHWGVFAGGRRYRSIKNLVSRGELPADWPIAGLVHEVADVELVAQSLDENFQRRDLEEYEVAAAVLREHRLGRAPAGIAERHGQTLRWVEQRIRLGDLAPKLFEAFAAGQLSSEQAAAFGATGDHELQVAAFDAMQARAAHLRTAAAIRAWLRVDDQEAAKLLLFVGEPAYEAVGGRFETDLFADGEDRSGRITDEPLLRRLADAKVQELRDATRARVGRPELRFVPQPPAGAYSGPDWQLHIAVANGVELPAGDVVSHIAISDAGEPDVTFWWASRKALAAESKPAAPPRTLRADGPAHSVVSLSGGAAIGHQTSDARRKADAQVKEEAGLTAEGTRILRSIRRAILRAALTDDARRGGSVGLDYLVFAQARMLLARAGQYGMSESARQLGIAQLHSSEVDGEPARAQVDESPAGKAWSWALRSLGERAFMTERNPAKAWADYRAQHDDVKRMTAAVVAGVAIEPSLDAEGYRVPLHDAVATAASAAHPQALRHWWSPTAAFLDLLPAADRRAAAEPFVSKDGFASWAKVKSAELTKLVLRALLGTAPSTTDAQKRAAKLWVHPLLAFDRGERTLAQVFAERDAAEQLEAAE